MTVEEFIAKWENCSGSERANYAVFLTELNSLLGVPTPDPVGNYRIDAPVSGGSEAGGTGFMDMYAPGKFVLEAKQSNVCEVPSLPGPERSPVLEVPTKYDELMRRAFRQARRYAQSLPEPPWPPFIVVLDVGRAFELYFDYSGNGRDYRFFPDRRSYRVPIRALAQTTNWGPLKLSPIELLRTIWTNPRSLDPALVTAEVTREVAKRLGSVSAWLEETQRLKTGASLADWEHSQAVEETSLFLMRILFCMFAEDAQLLAEDPDERPFKDFLERTLNDDEGFRRGLADLWQKMGHANLTDRWTFAFEHPVKYFNGSLFADTKVYELARAERGELLTAARHEWKNVEPAIFGTLLEQALTASQRSHLGAHYTPRLYVGRIVEATITEVLRAEWDALEASLEDKDVSERLDSLRTFHDRLASIVVLDPACGTGNFLYVAMEALLGLENKLIQAIEDLGGEVHSRVGPAQFHGLEKNPRAAKIAELVLWIGWLRWNIRNGAGGIEEPILAQRANINFGRPGSYDAILAQDDIGEPMSDSPCLAEWPQAEFIVGNPPFIGKGAKIRAALGQPYLAAMWRANPRVPRSANYVMQWWDRAATILTSPNSRLKRFGFVTTNTISQPFNRRVMERYLNAPDDSELRLSIIYAVPDHPWTKATGAAMVRIAMTVCARGVGEGKLDRVVFEEALETDSPILELVSQTGVISSKLSVGVDTTLSIKLRSNEGIATNGVLLAGRGFVMSQREAELLAQKIHAPEEVIRPYLAGAELMQQPRNRFVIDFSGLSERDAAHRAPAAFQHLLETVAVARRKVAEEKRTPDAIAYAQNWWLFAKQRSEFRALQRQSKRFIATTETTKFRVFQFVDSKTVTDHMIVGIALEDYFSLGVLSSSVHYYWTMAKCGMMGVATIAQGHRYTKSEIFDTFPFPAATSDQQDRIAAFAKDLDEHRKMALAETPDLTITEIYNLRAKSRDQSISVEEHERAVSARVGIIDRLHDQIDRAVAEAYDWPTSLPPEEIVSHVMSLNVQRATEEVEGHFRWLRPDYQEPRFGKN